MKLCESRSVLCEGFCKPAVEIIKGKDAEGHRFGFPRLAPVSTGRFSFFFGSFFFLSGGEEALWKPEKWGATDWINLDGFLRTLRPATN